MKPRVDDVLHIDISERLDLLEELREDTSTHELLLVHGNVRDSDHRTLAKIDAQMPPILNVR